MTSRSQTNHRWKPIGTDLSAGGGCEYCSLTKEHTGYAPKVRDMFGQEFPREVCENASAYKLRKLKFPWGEWHGLNKDNSQECVVVPACSSILRCLQG